jgi:hypothetical protein
MDRTESRKLVLTFTLLLLGALLLGVAWWLMQVNKSPAQFGEKIGWVRNELGEVFVVRGNGQIRESVSTSTFILPWDSIETASQSEAELDFSHGEKIKLAPESLIIIEKWKKDIPQNAEGFLINLKKGSFKVMTAPKDSLFQVIANGTTSALSEFENFDLAKQASTPQPMTGNLAETQTLLSDKEIESALGSQSASYRKCFHQLLQREPGARGNANISLIIDNSGKVTRPQVQSNDFKDTQFLSCLKEVTLRMKFRSFSGPVITTVFPISFE